MDPAKHSILKLTLCVLFVLSSPLACRAQLHQSLAPLIQNTSGRNTHSLNGAWKVIIDPYENGFYNYRYQEKENGYFKNQVPKEKSELLEYNFDASDQLHVPGDWNTQMERLFYYEGTVWYKKSFDFTPREDKRVFLHFGAVNYEAHVYLNGEKLGKHTGGFTPFNFEITGKIKNGQNFVVVKADNQRKKEAVPTLNTDWWNYGGITRDVSLVEVPATFILDYKVQLKKGTNDLVQGYVKIEGEQAQNPVWIEIPELKVKKRLQVAQGEAQFSFEANPLLWSPSSPKLYEVIIRSGTDRVVDQVGFRSVEVEGKDIFLNGKPVFLKGISIHEEAPFRSGRAYSREDAQVLLHWAKELGCNYVRLAHYPHNAHMVKEADRLGLMVWSEIPVYWTIQWQNPQALANAKNQLSESIARDKNRASVIIWSVANETPVDDDRNTFLQALVRQARRLDNTRLISAATEVHTDTAQPGLLLLSDPLASHLDVVGVNYYCGWYNGLPGSCGKLKWKSDYNKPVIMSEFGGGALYGYHGDTLTRWTEEYQVSVYENNLEMIKKMPFIRGMTPWLLMDFYSSRRPLPTIQDNYNRKGLVSEKGQKKAAFSTLRDFYTTHDFKTTHK